MKRRLHARLSLMMFLQFFVNGALLPILSLYLKDYLHLSGEQSGLVMSMSAVASLGAPLVGSLVADRIVRAERLYAACQLAAAVVMLVLSFERAFAPVLFVYLAYAIIFVPTNALANVIVFHHASDAKRRFGGIRMWGTIGWVAVAWLFGFLWLRGSGGAHLAERLPDALKLSAAASFVLGLYALTLPSARTLRSNRATLVPVESLRVLKRPVVALFVALGLLVAAVDAYYYFGTALFLAHLGYRPGDIMPLMSIGQLPEIVSMGLLGVLLGRLGFKGMFAVGVSVELVRYTIFAIGRPAGLVIAGLSLHGFAFAFFWGSAYVYLDTHSTAAARAGVQQLFAIATTGVGSFAGSLLAGRMFDLFAGANNFAFTRFWMIPAFVSLAALVALLVLFREAPASSPPG